jgi:hypothetical protein
MATRRRAAATGEQLARISGPFVSCNWACCNLLQRRDFRGLLTLRALRYFKRDLLIFLQRLEAVALNLGKMREQVFAAAVRRDEPKALSAPDLERRPESRYQHRRAFAGAISTLGSIKTTVVHLAITLWLRSGKTTRSQTHVLRRNRVDAKEYRHRESEFS